MKRSSFVAMILGTIGGILFALGICMILLPEWNVFKPGVIMGGLGIVMLFLTAFIWRRMEHKEPLRITRKTINITLIGILGSLLLGVGMCLAMEWNKMLFGILIGVIGIIVLLGLFPFIKGLE